MNNSIIRNSKLILEDIQYGLDTAKNWNDENFEFFYLYFSSPDKMVRKYSLLVFAAGLENWLSGSATIFLRSESNTPGKMYIFEDYINSFIDNLKAIQSDFPYLYKAIMVILFELNNRDKIDSIINSTNVKIINVIKKLLQDTNREVLNHSYDDVLREVNITS